LPRRILLSIPHAAVRRFTGPGPKFLGFRKLAADEGTRKKSGSPA
jgi:hypothetical protein